MPVRIDLSAVSTSAVYPPGWIPCVICLKPLRVHFDRKCPFDATEFSPRDAKEVWETFTDALEFFSSRHGWSELSLLDLSDAVKARHYMEARKRRLLKQIKEKR